MVAKRFFGLLLIVAMAVVFAGCKDEIDDAISKLGGSKADQEMAMGAISISAKNPMPKLLEAVKNKKLSELTRKNVAYLIGVQSESSNTDIAVEPLTEALKDAEPAVANEILTALEKIPGDKSLEALQKATTNKKQDIAAAATEILERKAGELDAQADKLVGAAAAPQQIKFLEEAVKINPANKQRIERLAGLYQITGQNDKAEALFSKGGKFVTTLKVLGPFPNDTQDYVDTAKVDFDTTVTSPTGAELMWTDFTDIPDTGIVDFRKSAAYRMPNMSFYAAFKLTSGAAGKANFKIYGVDETVSLWVNGKKAADNVAFTDNENDFSADVKSGENTVVIRVGSRRSPRFSIQVSGGKGLKAGI